MGAYGAQDEAVIKVNLLLGLGWTGTVPVNNEAAGT